MNQCFGTNKRIKTKTEFDQVINNSKKIYSHYFVTFIRDSAAGSSRVGVICSKKSIKLAVGRNRVKRVVREWFRLSQEEFDNKDMVFIVKRTANKASHEELWRCLKYVKNKSQQ